MKNEEHMAQTSQPTEQFGLSAIKTGGGSASTVNRQSIRPGNG